MCQNSLSSKTLLISDSVNVATKRKHVYSHVSNICNTDNQMIYLFIYLGFNVVFNTVQVISRRVVGRAEETST